MKEYEEPSAVKQDRWAPSVMRPHTGCTQGSTVRLATSSYPFKKIMNTQNSQNHMTLVLFTHQNDLIWFRIGSRFGITYTPPYFTYKRDQPSLLVSHRTQTLVSCVNSLCLICPTTPPSSKCGLFSLFMPHVGSDNGLPVEVNRTTMHHEGMLLRAKGSGRDELGMRMCLMRTGGDWGGGGLH